MENEIVLLEGMYLLCMSIHTYCTSNIFYYYLVFLSQVLKKSLNMKYTEGYLMLISYILDL
jgi:hypothetical protein